MSVWLLLPPVPCLKISEKSDIWVVKALWGWFAVLITTELSCMGPSPCTVSPPGMEAAHTASALHTGVYKLAYKIVHVTITQGRPSLPSIILGHFWIHIISDTYFSNTHRSLYVVLLCICEKCMRAVKWNKCSFEIAYNIQAWKHDLTLIHPFLCYPSLLRGFWF